jgi:hypothetical protein
MKRAVPKWYWGSQGNNINIQPTLMSRKNIKYQASCSLKSVVTSMSAYDCPALKHQVKQEHVCHGTYLGKRWQQSSYSYISGTELKDEESSTKVVLEITREQYKYSANIDVMEEHQICATLCCSCCSIRSISITMVGVRNSFRMFL